MLADTLWLAALCYLTASAFFAFVLYACCWVSGRCSRIEEQRRGEL